MTQIRRSVEEKMIAKAHLEFEKRITFAAKEAIRVRRAMKLWGILTTIGSLCSILLLFLYIFSKK